MKNKQLTREQRYQIQSLLQVGTSKKKISELIDTSVSSVYREIKRNQGLRGYTAAKAQEICDIRKERYCLCRKFTGSMERHIRDKLTTEQWSPQQIVGHAGLHGITMVSHERIYQFIRKDKSLGGNLWKHTRHQLKHRKRAVTGKQINIKNKVSIELRPPIVETKDRCGDWEIDTIIGKDGKGAILTITERQTGFLLMERLPMGKQAESLSKVAVRLLFAYKKTVHTITSDNGSEFANHEYISQKLNADFYFAHPYSSWERGLNEYTNGLIRQYITKSSDFELYSDDFISLVQNKINRRPREKLFFQSPSKIFYASLI
ncbi:IS30 family transposase [Bacteroidia bacterium]|nr:IS30 family transposase [Bacteroidia bacterium]GHV21537.1 IS30 family transposase [Bacteroidia bacterium]